MQSYRKMFYFSNWPLPVYYDIRTTGHKDSCFENMTLTVSWQLSAQCLHFGGVPVVRMFREKCCIFTPESGKTKVNTHGSDQLTGAGMWKSPFPSYSCVKEIRICVCALVRESICPGKRNWKRCSVGSLYRSSSAPQRLFASSNIMKLHFRTLT